MIRTFSTLATLALLIAPAAAQDSPGFTIAMEHGGFHATAYIGNNTGKVLRGSAVIDTGASVVTVCEQALALAHIYATDARPATMLDATGRTQQAKQITLAFVHVGNIKVENVVAVATPGPCRAPILIGMSWLARLSSVEMRGNVMTLK